MDKTAIRDAATIILVRRGAADGPSVLMGQRGASAAFMPDKFVFPGGAVDPVDAEVPLDPALPGAEAEALRDRSRLPPGAIAAAAIRELWEETGLILGRPGDWPDPPMGWRGFARTGHRPTGAGLRFVFRAVTPPGRSRRFDARFFLADADRLASDPDDFSRAEDELRHLQWVPLRQVRSFDLPFITEVVLAEVADRLAGGRSAGDPVPFFHHEEERHLFDRLGGASPLDRIR